MAVDSLAIAPYRRRMLFSHDLATRFFGWFLLAALIGLVAFLAIFNDLTRGLGGLFLFYYLFGAVVYHCFGENARCTWLSELVRWMSGGFLRE